MLNFKIKITRRTIIKNVACLLGGGGVPVFSLFIPIEIVAINIENFS
jgi:hypothetical protein